MQSNKLVENYRKSLKQKYNAVCFDIDGTLTKTNSKVIDERAIEMLADLLKRRIPIVFITGRGETGLKDLLNDISSKLCDNYDISKEQLLKMYALVNDGARLFFTSGESTETFDRSIYISSAKQLEELSDFNNEIINSLNSSSLHNVCKITYSLDEKKQIILNIRLVFDIDDDLTIETIVDLISSIIKRKNLNNLNVTRGIFGEKTVIQIGTTKKDLAVKTAEKMIGVPENSMIRIGDCGDIRGNDYSMLNCPQGYSVDKTSGNEYGCFPIINENGATLYGVEATIYLVNRVKLLPTVCLESADKYIYRKNYAEIEKNLLKGKKNGLRKYNNLVNEIFDLENGLIDLFDSFSGSIIIPMYEWELIDNDNPLKKLFDTKDEEKLLYSLRDDNNYLLRGSKVYYYFIANRMSLNNEDNTSKENVLEWYYNTIQFLVSAIDAVNDIEIINEMYTKKLLLGLFDNIRNILLVSLNYQIMVEYENYNVMINLNNANNPEIKLLYENLLVAETMMARICFEKNFNIDKASIITLLYSTLNYINDAFKKFKHYAVEKDYSKDFRTYREIDNFSENYVTAVLNQDKIANEKTYGVCGMCYGGMELPIIYKVINPSLKDISLFKFNKSVSGYKNKQLFELRVFDINEYGGIRKIGFFAENNYIVLDDNLLTGKTMQLVLNCMYDIGINIFKVGIVRYPGINRIDQMFMENHGAVGYRLFFDYIIGLYFPSPYSWRDENELDPYTDSLGVFDLNRKKIIECLIKNHDYTSNSEVNTYKGRVLK